jgi:hypothetical protein
MSYFNKYIFLLFFALLISFILFFNLTIKKNNTEKYAEIQNYSNNTETKQRKSVAAPGRQVYSVFQSHSSPVFTKVIIDPEDARLGQKQTMTAYIKDDKAPILEVIAEIKTDNKIIQVPLQRISGTDQDGVWEGSWVVEDTHDTTYTTIFKALNKENESSEIKLSWTDPGCSTDANHGTNLVISSSCTISGVDGADGGLFNITTGGTVTISSGATLVAARLAIKGGVLIKNVNSIISVSSNNIICMTDSDADGYSPTTTQYWETGSCSAGKRRRYLLTSITNTDCYDYNANARPGQTTCYSSHRGDGSFDYNCDGSQSSCGACATSYTSTPGLAPRSCVNNYCYTPNPVPWFTGYTCSNPTTTCGASGYSCSGSQAAGCNYYPCSLYDYYATSVNSCVVSCI